MKNLILSLLVFSIFNAFGQPSVNDNPYYSEKDVYIYLSYKDCINSAKGTAKQYLFIEIINASSSDVVVSFDKEIWYNNVCQTCESSSNEYKVEITIPANSKVTGDCNSIDKSLRIFSKMLNLDKVRKLSKYELKNINIENAQ